MRRARQVFNVATLNRKEVDVTVRLVSAIFITIVLHAETNPPQIWIRGDTTPTDSALFNFQIDGNTVAYNIATGTAAGPYVLTPGVHVVTESAGTGANLASYNITFSGDCVNADPGEGAVTLAAGDAKTCVINRIGPPTLQITVLGTGELPAGRSSDAFNVLVDGAAVSTNVPVGQGSLWTGTVSAGRHNIAEIAGTGTSLANYTRLFGGDCDADGSVTVTPNGKVSLCMIQNVPAYQFLFVTISAILGQSSGATLTLIGSNYVTVLQTFTLKKQGDPAWPANPNDPSQGTVMNLTFQLNPPLQLTDISSAVLSFVPAGSGDTMPLILADLSLGNTAASGYNCVIERGWPSTALTQSAPNLALSPDDPANNCQGIPAAPVFSLAPGSYTCPQTLPIADPSNSPILFTTDGSRPTGQSKFYVTPLTINGTETISAISVRYGGGVATQSKMTSGRYVCAPPPVCSPGQHCCSGVNSSTGSCNTACISNNTACKPLCGAGYKCCGAAGPTGACDDRCVPNKGSC
jgi:Chitobiase/beta-hexosaminidase C-terminal domain